MLQQRSPAMPARWWHDLNQADSTNSGAIQTETCNALERSENVFNVLSGRLSELKQQGRSVATAGGPIDIVWLERIAYALREMVPDAWPDAASMLAQLSWGTRARDALADGLKSLVGVGG